MLQMPQFTDQTAILAHLNCRSELHGDATVPAVDLKITLDVGNEVLDNFDPDLRAALYRRPNGNDAAELFDKTKDEAPMRILRFPKLKPLKWDADYPGCTLKIAYGISGANDLLFVADVDGVQVRPEGGRHDCGLVPRGREAGRRDERAGLAAAGRDQADALATRAGPADDRGREGAAREDARQGHRRDEVMAILNYTTTIDSAKTAMEIEQKLAKAGAQAVLKEYGPTGDLAALSFRMPTAHGVVSFRVPARTAGVLKAMQKRDSKVPRSLRTEKQAAKVAWRIAKDWIEAQLAIVEAEMADMVEVFLPYAQAPSGQTMYQALEANGLRALALEGPKP